MNDVRLVVGESGKKRCVSVNQRDRVRERKEPVYCPSTEYTPGEGKGKQTPRAFWES